ncbi:MAG: hypothetical protein QHH06_06505 [Clostridiales bacterium]|nr:hypothetical protein [Eubacteriales bacterium]MDH7566116.1 hypothetical protein [Clostridiales bacterium]
MIEVYYYLPSNEIEQAVECGIKLSRWFDKEVLIRGESKKCLSALLNPKDDPGRYRSGQYRCVKLQLLSNYCFVADKYLYDAGLHYPGIMKLYEESVVPVEEYIFGSYRLPECLVTSTVVPGQISLLDKRLDSPVLFSSSEELYVNNIIEAYKEAHQDFNDTLLYYFYCRLAQMGKVDKMEDDKKKIAIFLDRENRKSFTVKIPDMEDY